MTTTDITPFQIDVPQADVHDLHDRLSRTRWPAAPAAISWERGVPLAYLQDLAAYWRTGFDWRAAEARLNAIDQFTTTIDGQVIHFLHVRSPEPGALPMIVTHGWPSTPFEFTELIGPLTDPRAHGGDPADAFHVVIPSLPGYGFSTPVSEPGWGNLFRVAHAWVGLMDRLGYDRFAVQGTDVGSGVAGMLGMVAADRVVGIHLTGTVAAMPFGPPLDVDGLEGRDRERAEAFNRYQEDGLGYLHLQATRPQTLAYSLSDSPVGQLAWIVEKFAAWTDSPTGRPEDAVGRDELLTAVSVYWFGGTGATAAHATYEGMQAFRQMAAHGAGTGSSASPPSPPQGVAVFATDTTIRTVMDPGGTIEHWTEFDVGGHFPALEVPELLTGDLQSFFRRHR